MRNRNWWVRVQRTLVLVSSSAIVLSTTCARDVRKSVVSAGLDFVEGTAGLVLDHLFPVEDILSNQQ